MRHLIQSSFARFLILSVLLFVFDKAYTQGTVDQWTWWSGDKTPNIKGEYGTKEVANKRNKPGARVPAGNWKDAQGNLWLFGGSGRDSDGNEGTLNDLWKYSIKDSTWTWMGGEKVTNLSTGNFGEKKIESQTNWPGARDSRSLSWTDKDGKFWLFGGYRKIGEGDNADRYLNDLWKYDPDTKRWTWMSGNKEANEVNKFNRRKEFHEDNTPAARVVASGWADSEGNLWLFGGLRIVQSSPLVRASYSNDLWKYSIDKGEWAFVWGSEEKEILVDYNSNNPGGRHSAISWTDANDNLWLFGGFVKYQADVREEQIGNDLWVYNTRNDSWAYKLGDKTGNSRGSSGVPASRVQSCSWNDLNGNLWLFGGLNSDDQRYNDLWKYNGQTWTLKSGTTKADQPGEYGNIMVSSEKTIPGARSKHIGWTDGKGNLWMFGGTIGGDPSVNFNDLWVFGAFNCVPKKGSISPAKGFACFGGSVLLTAPEADAYQWFNNNELIKGATSKTYAAKKDGNYNVKLNPGTCEALSDNVVDVNINTEITIDTTVVRPTCSNPFGSVTLTGGGETAAGYTYSKDNGNTWVDTRVFSQLSGGTYTFMVRNSNNCLSDKVILTFPSISAIKVTATSINIPCSGGNAGSITATATGGARPYRFKIGTGNFGPDSTFTALPASTYIITVEDANKCTGSGTVVITQTNNNIKVVSTPNTIPCSGGNVGTISVVASGGTAPYQYKIGTGAFGSQSNFTALAAGTYIITVEDANKCSRNDTAVITQTNNNIKVVSTPNTIPCSGGNVGTISVAASGGTAPYQYKIGTGAFGSQANFTGLAAGTYIISVEDVNKCTRNDTAVIAQTNNNIKVVSTPNTIPCSGGNVGTISVVASGGTAPYQYKIGSGAFGSQSNFTALAAGSYIITVEDANKCTRNDTAIITQTNNNIKVVSTPNTIPCSGGNVGTISVVASGGTAPYQYKIGSGAFGSQSNFTALAAGTYIITVEDANKCSRNDTAVITQTNNNIKVVSTPNTIPCSGGNVGTISVVASGGTAPYQYKIGTGAFGSQANFAGLAAGTYIISVEDANKCTRNDTAIITQTNNNIKVVSTPNTIPCSGGNVGTISVVATGGTAPYQYKIGTGAFGSLSNFTALAAGTYIISVEDANKCTRNDTAIITQTNNNIKVVSTPNTIPCSGGNVGTISVVASGGTAPYQYKIGKGAFGSQANFTGLATGTYIISVEDANKCTRNDTAVITQTNNNIKVVSTPNTIPCSGGNMGTISVVASGGTAPYQYKIGSGAFGSQPNFTALAAGTYIITVEDANKCSRNDTAIITQTNNNIKVVSTPNTIPCSGGNVGTISVVASGGTAPYQYKIGTGAFGSQSNFTALAAGTYIISVEDANKCTRNDTAIITQTNNNIKVVSTPNTIPCSGGNVGTISVVASGGTAPYQYKIGTGAFGSQSNFTALAAGTYIITVEDANKCTRSDTAVIAETGTPVKAELTSKTDISCIGGSTGSAVISASGGTGKLTFTLGSRTAQDNGNFSGLAIGAYSVTVKDGSGCSAHVSFNIITLAGSGGEISPANPEPVCVGSSVELTASPGDSYQWTLNDVTIPGANTRTFNATKPGRYSVFIKTGSCSVLSTNTVVVSNKVCTNAFAQVATAFTPNANNKNDKLVPIYQNIAQLKYFRVFNRWGQKVFETNILGEGWDGFYKGEKQPLETYTWILECVDVGGKTIRNSGKTVLIR
jgi:gliding motility-associated-like protein